MAGYGNNDYQWGAGTTGNESYNFEMPEFGNDLNFQNFDTSQQNVPPNYNSAPAYGGDASMRSYYDPTAYTDTMYKPTDAGSGYEGNSEFDSEPPLLEELGINPNHIVQKTLAVLNPFRTTEQDICQDNDMAGPLVFCLGLGGFLLLSGKITFSYIYGIGLVGCIAFYCLLSLMATQAQVTFGSVASVLGYCLLPMVALSGINVLIAIQGTLGTMAAGISILWCAVSASKLFVTAYAMDHQQVLIAYPCALLYGVFALIIIF